MKKKSVAHAGIVASFLLPSLLGFLLFVVIPIIGAVILSFTSYSGGFSIKFIGLRNYITAFKSSLFINGLGVTFVYMFWSVIFQICIGLALALLLARSFKGCAFFRGMFYLPNILSTIAIGLAFMFIFEPKTGFVNSFLASLGLPTSQWLAGEKTALPVIIVVTVWQNFGYYMVLFIGGLQNINQSLYEAAHMDGAGPFRRFLSVTMPGLSPVSFYCIIIAVIRCFQVFDYIFIMTGGQAGGGPAGSTSVLAFDIYKNAFVNYRFGYAAAESVVLMLIIVIATLIQQRGQKKWVNYDIV